MTPKTYWQPVAYRTLIAIGFPDFKIYHEYPLFIKVTRSGIPDKREMVAIGCSKLPKNAQIILQDFKTTKTT